MSGTPLKDSLAQAAKDPLNPSYADALAFMDNLIGELKSYGVIDFTELKKTVMELPMTDLLHGKPSDLAKTTGCLFEFSNTVMGPNHILCLQVTTDLKFPDVYSVNGKAISLGMIFPAYQTGTAAYLDCEFSAAALKDGRFKAHLANDMPRYRSTLHSWADRDRAIQEFSGLLAQYGSPALSRQLRTPEPVVANPLRTALGTPLQP